MKRKFHVRFPGERAAATPLAYPTSACAHDLAFEFTSETQGESRFAIETIEVVSPAMWPKGGMELVF
jgi:hypothetical protein